MKFVFLVAFILIGCQVKEEVKVYDKEPVEDSGVIKAKDIDILSDESTIKYIQVNDSTNCVYLVGYRGNSISCDFRRSN
jgi:uncharacterized protein YcfL